MKNYKKMLILLILFVAVAGLTISSVDAAKKTTGKIYFKDGKAVNKHLGKGDYASVYYTTKGSGGQGYYSTNTMHITIIGKKGESKYYKLDKAIVKFSKKVNGKIYYSTKTFKSSIDDFGSRTIWYNPKNGYKPYYTKVTYKNR